MKRDKTKNGKIGKKLVLIDANAIVHRAFHALPPLTSPVGEPTNAVYGFTTILLRIIREIKPDYIAAAFDTPKPTFRHVAYAQYKATRAKTQEKYPNTEIIIVTGDMDTLQLVNKNTKVWTMKKGVSDIALYDEKAV